MQLSSLEVIYTTLTNSGEVSVSTLSVLRCCCFMSVKLTIHESYLFSLSFPQHVRLRCRAARYIAEWQNKHAPVHPSKSTKEDESWGGLERLLRYFREKWTNSKGLLKANDFTDKGDYDLRISIIKAVSVIKCKRGCTPRVRRTHFLVC